MLYVPGLNRRLFSVDSFRTIEGNGVTFDHNKVQLKIAGWICKTLTYGTIKESANESSHHKYITTEDTDNRKKVSCEILHKRLGYISNVNVLYASKMKLWEDTYAKSTSHTWCTECKIEVINIRPLSQTPMAKPDEPHQWISIDVVENPYTQSSDQMQGTETYMLTIIDIGAKYFWFIPMEKKTAATIIKALQS